MKLYIYTNAPDKSQACATTLADLALLVSALADPLDATNQIILARIGESIPEIGLNDDEPIELHFYSDATTEETWPATVGNSVAVSVGLLSDGNDALANCVADTIVSTYRTGTLPLSTSNIKSWLRGVARRGSATIWLQVRRTAVTTGYRTTQVLMPVTILDTVLTSTATGLDSPLTYYTAAQSDARFAPIASGSGDVTGPASSTDSALALYDGLTGKLLKDSALTYSGTTLSVPDAFVISSAGSIGLTSGGNSNITIAPAGTGAVLLAQATAKAARVTIGATSDAYSAFIYGGNNANGVAFGTNAGASAGQIQGYNNTFGAVQNLLIQNAGGNLGFGNSASIVTFSGTTASAPAGTASVIFNGGTYTAGRVVSGSTRSLAAWGVTGPQFAAGAYTFTDSSSSGTVATAVANSFAVPTFAASSSTTFTNAANLYIAGDVAAGSGVTLTNSYGLWNVGKSRLEGRIDNAGGININPAGGAANAYLGLSADSAVKDFSGWIDTNATNPRTWLIGPGSGGAVGFNVYDSTATATVLNVDFSGRLSVGYGSRSASSWTTSGIVFATRTGRTFTNSSTAGSGTAASAVFNSFAVPTLAATNSSVTTTDAATVYIAGDVAAGTNQTLTNSYGLWNVGKTRLDGAVVLPSTNTAGLQLYNTADQVTNYERLQILFSSNVATIQTLRGGSGTLRNLSLNTGTGNPGILIRSGTSSGGSLTFSSMSSSGAGDIGFAFSGHTSTATSGTNIGLSLTPTYNQASGTASNTDLLINRTQTAVGSGAQLLADFQVGGVSKFNVSNIGQIVQANSATDGNASLTQTNDARSWLLGVDGAAADQWRLRDSTGGVNVITVQTGIAATAIAIAGTGNVTLSNALITTPQALSGAGAVNVTTTSTFLTSTGVLDALTLANGTAGQIKTIVHQVDGGSAILTPTSKIGYTTITFTNVGDSVTLQYTAAGWAIVGIYGAIAA